MAQEQKNVQEQDLNQLRKVRREKLAELQGSGKDPFVITKYDQTHHSVEVKENYEELEGKQVSIAGRMMSKRVMGKASFCNVQDLKGNIQSYVARDSIGEENYKEFKKLDVGDVIGIEGEVFKTKTGEISIHASHVTLLSKSLQILPEKFHGLTSKEAVQAFAHGARSMTHVYNGMTPFNHRANGLVGAAYRMKSMYGEIICDGNHSTPLALHQFFEAKGPHYGIMVSDALMAKGSPAGSKFIFGGNEIEIYEDGSAHLTSSKGLAGSTLHINEGLRILIEEALVPVDTAINSCTKNPAACLKIDDRKGSIKVGLDADLVVLDRDYQVLQTYCMGKAMLDKN